MLARTKVGKNTYQQKSSHLTWHNIKSQENKKVLTIEPK